MNANNALSHRIFPITTTLIFLAAAFALGSVACSAAAPDPAEEAQHDEKALHPSQPTNHLEPARTFANEQDDEATAPKFPIGSAVEGDPAGSEGAKKNVHPKHYE